ncbi:MAG TPA: hypothetical protein VHF26_18550 [Trebonia sp.]|nr:hypothetical protein [Trebonia sp.]
MIRVDWVARSGQSAEPGGLPAGALLTLTGEHVLLPRQVMSRAGELPSAVAHGRRPAAEPASLAGRIRAEVLPQVPDEETLLAAGEARPTGRGWYHGARRSPA